MRRLSRCLKVFAPFYPPGSWKKIRRRIGELMAAAGAVRDCDIAAELAVHAGVPRRSAIIVQLAAQRRKTGRDLLLAVRRWNSREYPRRWHVRLEVGAAGRPSRAALLSAARHARRTLPPQVRGYFAEVRQLLAASAPPAELHTIRLATKRLRYTLELFRPCYGATLEGCLSALQRLQQLLGEVNDCAAAERLIEGLLPESPIRLRLGHFLRRRASAKAAALRTEWRGRFDAPGREQWWLRYLAKNPRAVKRAL